MKSVLFAACFAALSFSCVTAFPVIRFERTPITTGVTIAMAYRICGLNARCLLNQEIIGTEDEDVRREYSALVQLAILGELSGLINNADVSVEKDSSSEEAPVPEVPSPGRPDVVDVPAHEDDPEPEEVPAGATHRVRVIAIHRPFGTRHVILISPVFRNGDANESGPREFPDPATSDESSIDSKPSANPEPKVSDESGTEGVVSPDNASSENTPTSETPGVNVGISTELTNAIEQNTRGSKQDTSEEDRREPLSDDSVEPPADQVEVFDPVKPMRMVGEDRFKYEAGVPEIRQV